MPTSPSVGLYALLLDGKGGAWPLTPDEVAATFLLLGFLTGLLGINAGGIPGAENPFAFAIFTGMMVLVVMLQVLILRWTQLAVAGVARLYPLCHDRQVLLVDGMSGYGRVRCA